MKKETKFILATGIIIYFLLIAYFIKNFETNSGNFGVTIYVPWGFITIFISFYLFREFNRGKKAKRDERRAQMNERRQELLDNVLKKKKDTQGQGEG